MPYAGLEKVIEKSGLLEVSLRDSRNRREKEAADFIVDMQMTQEGCLEKEKLLWSRYSQEKEEKGLNYIRDQKYLDDLLKSTSTKADSRRTSVRRWN